MLVRRMLPTGGLALDLIASHLAVHPCTLQRQLAAEGRTFAEIVDDVRRDEAQHDLRRTRSPFGQLAGLLGYSEERPSSAPANAGSAHPPRTTDDTRTLGPPTRSPAANHEPPRDVFLGYRVRRDSRVVKKSIKIARGTPACGGPCRRTRRGGSGGAIHARVGHRETIPGTDAASA